VRILTVGWPTQINFELLYVPVDQQWCLFGISVSTWRRPKPTSVVTLDLGALISTSEPRRVLKFRNLSVSLSTA
jgi:hypothetical protein